MTPSSTLTQLAPFGTSVSKTLWGWEPSHNPKAYADTLPIIADLGFDSVTFMLSMNNRDFSAHLRYAEEAVRHGLRVSVWPFINMSVGNMEQHGPYGWQDLQMDPAGRPICRDMFTTLSFASPHIHAATDFVGRVAEAFRDLQNDGHLLYFAPITTCNGEVSFEHSYGGWGEHGWKDIGYAAAVADYNPLFLDRYRQWLMEERYGNCTKPLDAINYNWGTQYSSLTDIMPAMPFETCPSQVNRTFVQWWKSWDWYAFRLHMLRGFIRESAEKIEAVGGWKHAPVLCNNVGSYNDSAVGSRCTASPEALLAHPWVTCFKDNPWLDFNIDFDASLLVGAARRRNGWSILTLTSDTRRANNVEAFIRNYKTAVDRGVNSIAFAFLNPLFDPAGQERTETKDILFRIQRQLVADGYWDKPRQTPEVGAELTYTETEILSKMGINSGGIHGPSSIEARFHALRAGGKAVDVRAIQDVSLL